jgi:TonB family protein
MLNKPAKMNMKKDIISLILALSFFSASSQDVRFTVNSIGDRHVKKGALLNAGMIRDFMPGFPVNWITRYTSVEISGTCSGKPLKAIGKNERLSQEQQHILDNADMASELTLDVNYQYLNPVNSVMEPKNIHVVLTIQPDSEASYAGGEAQMQEYLRINALNKVSATIAKNRKTVAIRFTIDETGQVDAVRLSKSSGDISTDHQLIDAIRKMPQWRPAENAKGQKVKQEFEFRIGVNVGGC